MENDPQSTSSIVTLKKVSTKKILSLLDSARSGIDVGSLGIGASDTVDTKTSFSVVAFTELTIAAATAFIIVFDIILKKQRSKYHKISTHDPNGNPGLFAIRQKKDNTVAWLLNCLRLVYVSASVTGAIFLLKDLNGEKNISIFGVALIAISLALSRVINGKITSTIERSESQGAGSHVLSPVNG